MKYLVVFESLLQKALEYEIKKIIWFMKVATNNFNFLHGTKNEF